MQNRWNNLQLLLEEKNVKTMQDFRRVDECSVYHQVRQTHQVYQVYQIYQVHSGSPLSSNFQGSPDTLDSSRRLT